MNIPHVYKKHLDELYASADTVNDLSNWRTVIDLWRGTANTNVIKCYIAPWGNDVEISKSLITKSNISTFKGKELYVSLDRNAVFKKEVVTENHLNYYVIYADDADAYNSGAYGDGSRNKPFSSINKARSYLCNYRATGTINFEIIALVKDGQTEFTFNTYQYLLHPDATGSQGDDDGCVLVLRTAPFYVKDENNVDVENINDVNPDFVRATFHFTFFDTLMHNRWNAITISGSCVRIEDVEIKYTYLNEDDYVHPNGTTVTQEQRRNWWQRSIGINVSNNGTLYTDNVYVTGFCCGFFINTGHFVIYNDLIIKSIPIAPCQYGYNTVTPPFSVEPIYQAGGYLGSKDSFADYCSGIILTNDSRLQVSNRSRTHKRYRENGRKTFILIKNHYRGISVGSSSVTSWIPATGTDNSTMQPLYDDPVTWIITDCFMGIGVYGAGGEIRSIFPYWVGTDNVKYGYDFIKTGLTNGSLSTSTEYYSYIESTFPSRYMFMGLFQMGANNSVSNAKTGVDDSGVLDYKEFVGVNEDGEPVYKENTEAEVFTTNVSWNMYINNVGTLPLAPSNRASYVY